MNLVSIIVPVYNVEKYLERCVESIRRQTYENLEIILVDDGSPDNCGVMCDMFKSQDKRIKVIHKKNEGLGLTRNAGLNIATGDYVTFIDSDDWIDADHIMNLLNASVDTEADICFGGCTRVFSSGDKTTDKNNYKDFTYKGCEIEEHVLLPMIGAKVGDNEDVGFQSSVCMNLYKMAIIQKNNLRFGSEKVMIAEDVFFNLRYLKLCQKAIGIPIVSYNYFINTQSISQKYDQKRFERTLGFYSGMKELLAELEISSDAAQRLIRTFLVKVRVLIKQIIASDLRLNAKLKLIYDTISNETIQECLNEYPIEKCKRDTRMVLVLMKKKAYKRLYVLLYTKNVLDTSPRIRGLIRKLRGLQ